MNQLCVKNPPLCLQFDSLGRLCTRCIAELTLEKGNCKDNNCAVSFFSRCTVCNNNFAPNPQGICINSNCISLSQGVCVRCAQGFTLNSANSCITASPPAQPAANGSTSTPSTASIVGCALVASDGTCTRCAANFFGNGRGGCKRVIIGCLQMDAAELTCLQCMSIYTRTADGGCLY